MRRKLAKPTASRTNKPPRRRGDADLPAVPTYPADPKAAATPPPTTEDDQADEVVRRIVEAAYT